METQDRRRGGTQAVRRAVLEHMGTDPKAETSFSLLLVSVVLEFIL